MGSTEYSLVEEAAQNTHILQPMVTAKWFFSKVGKKVTISSLSPIYIHMFVCVCACLYMYFNLSFIHTKFFGWNYQINTSTVVI